MNGLKRNIARLFDNDGKLFVMAMDHAQCGLVEGLESPVALIESRRNMDIDGFLVNVGVAELAEEQLLGKKVLLRTSSGGSAIADSYTNLQKNHVSAETALSMGVDAVVMMMTFGGDDYVSIQDAARAIDSYHKYNIPVVVEILANDFPKTQTFDIQANGTRIAAELGADVVKAFFTDKFETIVKNCPVPIILAGGPKGSNIEDVAREAVSCGVKGFAFGRNLFQNDNPGDTIARLSRILHDRA